MISELKNEVREYILDEGDVCEELNDDFKGLKPMIDSLCERIQKEVSKEDIIELWNEYHCYDSMKLCTHKEFISEYSGRMISPKEAIEYMGRAEQGYWCYDDEYTTCFEDCEILSFSLDDLFLFDDEIFKHIMYYVVNHGEFENFFHFDEPPYGDYEKDLKINGRIKSYVGIDLVEPIILLATEIAKICGTL